MANIGMISGKSSRKHKDIKFAEQRYSVTRVIYPWKDTDIGRRALCHIYLSCLEKGTDDELRLKKPSELGITRAFLLKRMKEFYPDIFEDHLMVIGTALDGQKLMSRFGNMYRDNGRKIFAMGPEHPKNHPDLVNVLDEVVLSRRGGSQ